mmetsp:Transcript_40686/g.116161  ORF Transcript_40686/g.116161 Transcript_40686/m.116161 type:complete len:247 (+) Transcript_40686:191-931(+)
MWDQVRAGGHWFSPLYLLPGQCLLVASEDFRWTSHSEQGVGPRPGDDDHHDHIVQQLHDDQHELQQHRHPHLDLHVDRGTLDLQPRGHDHGLRARARGGAGAPEAGRGRGLPRLLRGRGAARLPPRLDLQGHRCRLRRKGSGPVPLQPPGCPEPSGRGRLALPPAGEWPQGEQRDFAHFPAAQADRQDQHEDCRDGAPRLRLLPARCEQWRQAVLSGAQGEQDQSAGCGTLHGACQAWWAEGVHLH